MRASLFRTAVCLTWMAAVTSTACAGVRGKSTKLKDPVPASSRVAQSDDSTVNTKPVPVPMDPTPVGTETVVTDTVVPASNGANSVPAATKTNRVDDPMPMLVAPTMMPMPEMNAPLNATCCGGPGGGWSPAAASYSQAFPGGFYRGGPEAGMSHFPYYSYRRPWYFPGQPSFHRSTDYVW